MKTHEIIFRAWNDKDRRFNYFMFNNVSIYSKELSICLLNGEPFMQFTGVYDIDGKEIYMGDICSNEVAKWIIVFDRGCFSVKMVGRESSIYLALRGVVGLRVIGNIHENKNLL